jgi:hypothetical protein
VDRMADLLAQAPDPTVDDQTGGRDR